MTLCNKLAVEFLWENIVHDKLKTFIVYIVQIHSYVYMHACIIYVYMHACIIDYIIMNAHPGRPFPPIKRVGTMNLSTLSVMMTAFGPPTAWWTIQHTASHSLSDNHAHF